MDANRHSTFTRLVLALVVSSTMIVAGATSALAAKQRSSGGGCSGLSGGAAGLCNAYCEAQDCPNNPGKQSCASLRKNFERQTGSSTFPCDVGGPVATTTPTPVETSTPAETATPVETATPAETTTPAETATPIETATVAGATATPTPGATTTAAATATGGATSTAAVTPTETAAAPTATSTAAAATATAGETATPAETATPGPAETPSPTATPSGVACPSQITFLANGSAADLDTGWTGQSHDNHVINDGLVTVNVTGCTNSVASVTGPAPNAGGTGADNPSNNRRCVSATWVPCSTDSDCTGFGNSCVFFFGAPLPLSSGGVSVCVVNQVTGTITGTVNISTGDAVNNVSLVSHVFNGPTLAQPCPVCGTGAFGSASTCSSGPRSGDPCVVNGTSDLFGSTSFDCPPDPGALIANLNVPLTLSTGAQSRTLTDASPTCTATGFTSLKCFCDTCANAAANACSSNADCNGAVCGGKRCIGGTSAGSACTTVSDCPGTGTACGRPGKTTAPNECDDGMCSANPADTDSVNEGQCEAGPFEQFCNIERFRGCTSDANCTAPNDTCSFGKNRECYTDNGVVNTSVQVQGEPDPFVGGVSNGTLGAFFCVGPTTAPAVNGVAGLPGLGRLTLPGTATLVP